MDIVFKTYIFTQPLYQSTRKKYKVRKINFISRKYKNQEESASN